MEISRHRMWSLPEYAPMQICNLPRGECLKPTAFIKYNVIQLHNPLYSATNSPETGGDWLVEHGVTHMGTTSFVLGTSLRDCSLPGNSLLAEESIFFVRLDTDKMIPDPIPDVVRLKKRFIPEGDKLDVLGTVAIPASPDVFEHTITVGEECLDFNNHVNFQVYRIIAIDALQAAAKQGAFPSLQLLFKGQPLTNQIKSCEVLNESETVLGETLTVLVWQEEPGPKRGMLMQISGDSIDRAFCKIVLHH